MKDLSSWKTSCDDYALKSGKSDFVELLMRSAKPPKLNRLTKRLIADVMADKVDGTYDLTPYRSYKTSTVDGVLQGTYLFAILAIGGTRDYAKEQVERILGSRGLGKMRPDDAAYIKAYIALARQFLGTVSREGVDEVVGEGIDKLDVSPMLREMFVLNLVEPTEGSPTENS